MDETAAATVTGVTLVFDLHALKAFAPDKRVRTMLFLLLGGRGVRPLVPRHTECSRSRRGRPRCWPTCRPSIGARAPAW